MVASRAAKVRHGLARLRPHTQTVSINTAAVASPRGPGAQRLEQPCDVVCECAVEGVMGHFAPRSDGHGSGTPARHTVA